MGGLVLSYLTMKGGVGKTTLAANVTRAMADFAELKPAGAPTKFLLIDADAQCNLTQIFLTPEEMENRAGRNIYQAFNSSHRLYGPSDLKTTVHSNATNNTIIDLIPGSFETFALVVGTPAKQKAAAQAFHQFMKAARDEYDLIVIDTNPSATFTTLQALEVSDFLVCPITFDAFALRGIDLIVRTLVDRYPWLGNPNRIRIVPNKIKRAPDEAARRRQEADERAIVAHFNNLEESISLSRIHESKFLDNRLARRGQGFAADQRVFPMLKPALRKVVEDFTDVAKALNATLMTLFDHETQNEGYAIRTVQDAIPSFLDQSAARPH